ncbi:transcriptional regulator [Leptospira fletcheri]|uniref:Transcriptional regulator n=1 Tax=Leptospira fletcheri TaxID=2484981 RepID=A0A4R9GB48_9LEPT|nr:FecR family protein [Leptospira fletcheri]TGK08861.1 transcriptional regulator [Leptospira fletcheri]
MNEEQENKIKEAIEGKSNELSGPIQSLHSLIGKAWPVPDSDLPSFEDLYGKARGSRVIPLNRRVWFSLAAALVLIAPILYLFKFGTFTHPTLPKSSILVTKITGKVYLSATGSADRLVLNEGETVGKGQILLTDKDSSVFLSVSKGEGILLGSATRFEILNDPKKSFYLHSGNAFAHLHKNLKKEDFRIFTSNGLIEVRGTKFSVSEIAGTETQVSVLEGRVAAIRKEGGDSGEQVLEPGQRIRLSNKGFQRSFLSSSELTELEAEFRRLKVEDIPRDPNRSFSDREELFKEFQRLERVIMTDKTSLEGVIIDMDGEFMYLQTLEKEIRIPRDSVEEVIQVR